MADNIGRNEPLLYQVGINPMHICVCLGKSELFLFFLCRYFRRTVGQRSYPLSQQFLYRSLKVHIIKFLHEFYCSSADLIFVVKPGRATEGYTVVPAGAVTVNELMLSADTLKLFTTHTQVFCQIYAVGKDFLFVCKWDIWHFITALILHILRKLTHQLRKTLPFHHI